MYKPIKRLYFWLKSKVYKMNYTDTLIKLQADTNRMLQNFNSFFQSPENKGYIIKSNDEIEGGFNYQIGTERFSLFWFIYIPEETIYLKTFYWKFNPNISGNRVKTYIKELDIIRTKERSPYIQFIEQLNDRRNPKTFDDFQKDYFSHVETYLSNDYDIKMKDWQERLLLKKG